MIEGKKSQNFIYTDCNYLKLKGKESERKLLKYRACVLNGILSCIFQTFYKVIIFNIYMSTLCI